jgi:hypothetical protein
MAETAPEAVSKVDQGVKAAEAGDKNALATVLNAENVYDRAALAGGIKKAVEESGSGLPKLDLVTQPDASGKDVLTDIKATDAAGQATSLYHNEMKQEQYSRDYSFSHPKQTTYDTLDPATGKIIAEDVALADGRKSHNTVEYDAKTGAMTGKAWQWADGMTEHYSYDAAGRETKSDVQWQRDGKLVHNQAETKYDPVTGKKASVDKTFTDGKKSTMTFDSQGRLLTEDSISPDKKEYHYTARYSDKSQKLEYEKQLDESMSRVETFDHETGQPLTLNQAYSWGTIAEEHKYDPTTHQETYYHRTDSDGTEDIRKADSAGHLLTEDWTRADKKNRHTQATWDGDHLLTRDETSFDGSKTHLENIYDPTTGKRTKMLDEATSAKGEKSSEVDTFNPATGAIVSEDIAHSDGSKERVSYDRVPQTAVHGKVSPEHVVNITDTDTAADGTSRDYKYEYRYNDTAKPPTERLQLKWSGTGEGGKYTDAEEHKIRQMMYQHTQKAH